MADFIGSYPPPMPTGQKDLWDKGPQGTWSYLDQLPAQPGDPYDPSAISEAKYAQRQALKLLILQNRQDLKDARKAEMLDKIANQASARAIAEAAFDGMVSSCVNKGQVDKLLSIKKDWIDEACTGTLPTFETYMSKWQIAVGD